MPGVHAGDGTMSIAETVDFTPPVQQTVIRKVFHASEGAAKAARAALMAQGVPVGRLRQGYGGWGFSAWHSGPMVYLS